MSATVSIKPYVAPAEEANPYLDTIDQLIAAGPESAIEVVVDAKHASAEQLKVQKAANAKGHTARLRERDDSKVAVEGQNDKGKDILSGTVVLTFQLTDKHKPRRGKGESATDSVKDGK